MIWIYFLIIYARGIKSLLARTRRLARAAQRMETGATPKPELIPFPVDLRAKFAFVEGSESFIKLRGLIDNAAVRCSRLDRIHFIESTDRAAVTTGVFRSLASLAEVRVLLIRYRSPSKNFLTSEFSHVTSILPDSLILSGCFYFGEFSSKERETNTGTRSTALDFNHLQLDCGP